MIRPATPTDAFFAAPLIQETIGDIGLALTGARRNEEAEPIIAAFFRQPANRLSFENTFVAELGGRPAGLLIAYDGARAHDLDAPFRERLRTLGLRNHIDSETSAGEFYLDTIVVQAAHRGRGLAKRLILAAEEEARTLGLPTALLVSPSNTVAWNLYRSVGYEEDARVTVAGHAYAHLVKRP
ncbi:GNAT family N-acetyltransferase [Deinococcus yavapaiensis]|uniref:Acetyltransferase (GNAT) family protein n=1 Tax=Deinococcus yavapaiensis KR-236 TaxID=694435 RepID=A0A318S4G8_9DEIO|nr:N-acetyltransferase [Deinococcus yavapaiensis]PYE52960.1 acetyltransferase (GNAT) family protein [Deinococcus yavapaiensis KR-236]